MDYQNKQNPAHGGASVTCTTLPPNQPASAPVSDDVNAPAYVLPMLSDYMLETCFEAYRLTVSGECRRSADAAALFAYAAHIVPLPLRIEVWTGDRPASVLARLASLLVPSAVVSVDCMALADPSKPVRLSTNLADRHTDSFVDMQLLPNRARMDAGYIRQRLAVSANIWRDLVKAAGERPGAVLRTLAVLAGDRWPMVAAWMIGGGVA